MSAEPKSSIPDDWEESFEGKCDLCRKPKKLEEVNPGVQFGWRVGYVCRECSSKPTESEKVPVFFDGPIHKHWHDFTL